MRGKEILVVFLFVLFLGGCATTPPVREALQEQVSVPAGRVEGSRFTGVRYPFKVSAPSHWKMTTEFPEFLEKLGYGRPGPYDKEQTELYLYNPASESSVQIDLTPAGRYAVFSQQRMEGLVSMMSGDFVEELEQEHGKGVKVEFSPTQPVSLKGVQYAARRSATYAVKGQTRENGWVYGFSEPYQLFILFQITDKMATQDRQDLQSILNSFEVLPRK